MNAMNVGSRLTGEGGLFRYGLTTKMANRMTIDLATFVFCVLTATARWRHIAEEIMGGSSDGRAADFESAGPGFDSLPPSQVRLLSSA